MRRLPQEVQVYYDAIDKQFTTLSRMFPKVEFLVDYLIVEDIVGNKYFKNLPSISGIPIKDDLQALEDLAYNIAMTLTIFEPLDVLIPKKSRWYNVLKRLKGDIKYYRHFKGVFSVIYEKDDELYLFISVSSYNEAYVRSLAIAKTTGLNLRELLARNYDLKQALYWRALHDHEVIVSEHKINSTTI